MLLPKMSDPLYDNYSIYRLDRYMADTNAAIRAGDSEIDALKRQINKMALVNQALFDLLKERLDITDEDLRRKIVEIDRQDGREDGQMNPPTLACPKCHTTVTAGALKCYSCGANLAPKRPYSP